MENLVGERSAKEKAVRDQANQKQLADNLSGEVDSLERVVKRVRKAKKQLEKDTETKESHVQIQQDLLNDAEGARAELETTIDNQAQQLANAEDRITGSKQRLRAARRGIVVAVVAAKLFNSMVLHRDLQLSEREGELQELDAEHAHWASQLYILATGMTRQSTKAVEHTNGGGEAAVRGAIDDTQREHVNVGELSGSGSGPALSTALAAGSTNAKIITGIDETVRPATKAEQVPDNHPTQDLLHSPQPKSSLTPSLACSVSEEGEWTGSEADFPLSPSLSGSPPLPPPPSAHPRSGFSSTYHGRDCASHVSGAVSCSGRYSQHVINGEKRSFGGSESAKDWSRKRNRWRGSASEVSGNGRISIQVQRRS